MKTFALYDENGQPLPGAAPTFAYFGNRTGTPSAPPVITDMGDGVYQFDDTMAGQFVYLITAAGTVYPKYLFGSIFDDPFNPFATLFFTDDSGAPWSGANTGLAFEHIELFDGTPVTPPTIVRVNTSGPEQGLYTFNCTMGDVAQGVEWLVHSPNTAIPEFLDGNFFPDSGGAPPTTISLLSGAVFDDHIILTFDKNVNLTGASAIFSNWTITGSPTITVSSLLVTTNQVRLNFNTTTNGFAYTLNIPLGIESTSAEPYIGPYTYPFNAVPPPTPSYISLIAGSIFDDHIILTFDKNVNLTPPSNLFSNWTVTGGTTPLVVTSLVVSTNTVRLNHNTITDGEARVLNIPNGIESTLAEAYIGPFTFNFNSVYLSPVIHFVSGTVFADHINLLFDKPVALSSLAAIASNWTIDGDPGNTPLVVGSIQVIGNTVRLNINEASDGGNYTVNFPTAGIQSTGGDLYFGPFVYNFTAIGVPPYIAQAISLDAFTVRIYYSEAVVQADALVVSNYGVTPTLTIYSVVAESDSIYVLTTSAQTPGQSYTLTVSNVRDLQNNPL